MSEQKSLCSNIGDVFACKNEDWVLVCQRVRKREPEVTVINTSVLGSGLVAARVPWERLGFAAREYRRMRNEGRKPKRGEPHPFREWPDLKNFDNLDALAQAVRDLGRHRYLAEHPERANV
jgi:hypothetical protein